MERYINSHRVIKINVNVNQITIENGFEEVQNVFAWICCGNILLTFIYSELEPSEPSPGGEMPH